ncbi:MULTISPECIES: hypothetical protein [Mycobacterium]|nr:MULTISPECIES: hypothetical protein [Mycobacterium]
MPGIRVDGNDLLACYAVMADNVQWWSTARLSRGRR